MYSFFAEDPDVTTSGIDEKSNRTKQFIAT